LCKRRLRPPIPCQGFAKELVDPGLVAEVSSKKQLEEEERFLSAQADRFAGANAEEKASACSVRNDGG
jgi:hypothetical protein